MSLTLRIFLAYFFIVVVASAVFLNVLMSELKPGVRQSSEHSLIDTANLIAEFVPVDFDHNADGLKGFSPAVERFLNRKYQAEISSVDKLSSHLRIYITNADGIVRYDSFGRDVGADYSRWNDVYLTLRGKYGARSTKADPNDEFSSVMHVSAPILSNNKIIGVLTVAKPNFSVQPFIDKASQKVFQQGLLLVFLSLAVALTIAYLLTRSIRKLVTYADNVSHGKAAYLPQVYESELSNLAASIENMKIELEGKEYVEKYVYALTHELKSPIAAIKGASELLSPEMPELDQVKFIANIAQEIYRMDIMVNRLLSLVMVEKQDELEAICTVNVELLCQNVIKSKQTQLTAKNIIITMEVNGLATTQGDQFLLTQAVDNLVQNAIDFANEDSEIIVAINVGDALIISVIDQGAHIPDYALKRIFEHFYSLPRPNSHRKSSGLGLCFVKQIAGLHSGDIRLENIKHGVKATLSLKVY